MKLLARLFATVLTLTLLTVPGAPAASAHPAASHRQLEALNVLLTNDDGYQAGTLAAMKQALTAE